MHSATYPPVADAVSARLDGLKQRRNLGSRGDLHGASPPFAISLREKTASAGRQLSA